MEVVANLTLFGYELSLSKKEDTAVRSTSSWCQNGETRTRVAAALATFAMFLHFVVLVLSLLGPKIIVVVMNFASKCLPDYAQTDDS